jgi:hypothetical protein
MTAELLERPWETPPASLSLAESSLSRSPPSEPSLSEHSLSLPSLLPLPSLSSMALPSESAPEPASVPSS